MDDILSDSERLINRYHDPKRFSMIRMGLAPCWHGFDSKREVLDGSVELARKYKGVKLHSHLAESRVEVDNALAKFGYRPVEYVRRLGWLGEMRISYLANQLQYGNHGPSAEQILEIATIGGAKVLGREDDIGSLEAGKAADIVLLDWDQLDYAGGRNDPVASIVLSGDSRMVHTVFVNGEIVVKEGHLTKVDEKEAREYVNKTGKDMLKKASVRVEGLKKDCD